MSLVDRHAADDATVAPTVTRSPLKKEKLPGVPRGKVSPLSGVTPAMSGAPTVKGTGQLATMSFVTGVLTAPLLPVATSWRTKIAFCCGVNVTAVPSATLEASRVYLAFGGEITDQVSV